MTDLDHCLDRRHPRTSTTVLAEYATQASSGLRSSVNSDRPRPDFAFIQGRTAKAPVDPCTHIFPARTDH